MTIELQPMLPTAGAVPSDEGSWAYEPRWFGLRALAVIDDGSVRLVDQHGVDISSSYPELLPMGSRINARDAVLDGEIIAVGPDGRPDVDALQERIQIDRAVPGRPLASEIPVRYLVYDLLSLDGRLTVNMSYAARRDFLDTLGLEGPSWTTSPSWSELTLEDALAATADQGLDGVVAKRLGARYQPGQRSDDWRTFARQRSQDLVVGGWIAGEDDGDELIGLLVGYHDDGGLRYAGEVRAGIAPRRARLLHERLEPLDTPTVPFVGRVAPTTPAVHWVEPRIVVRVAFTAWGDDGQVREATYRGLRVDADPTNVMKEE